MFVLNIIPWFCLLGGAFSSPIDLGPQNVPAEAYLPKIASLLSRLDSTLKVVPNGGTFEEAAGRATELIRLQMDYTNLLREGSTDILRGQMMAPANGMKMRESILQVGKLLDSTMSGWVHAKTMVVAAGKRPNAYQELITASTATTVFGDAFVSKMPPAVQAMGKSFSKGCTRSLETAIRAYRD
jgi:hypothetical protein